jgi:hypothetical protein
LVVFCYPPLRSIMRCWLRIGAFALSGNHALAIEEICSLALSVFFKKPINFGNDCL